jgi:hypothetical protein
MSGEIAPDDLQDLEKALAHYGVKGMKWGVRKSRGDSGGGTLKVKYRPTYNNEERRQAKAAVKTAKKSGTSAKDTGGADQARLAKLNTPTRRGANFVAGTKYTWGAFGVTGASVAGAILSGSPEALVGALAVGGVTGGASQMHQGYKVFFQNYKNNPRSTVKTDLSASELAKFASGKAMTKEILGKRGSVVVKSGGGKQTVTVRDREGRTLGSQTKAIKPPKPPKPKTS